MGDVIEVTNFEKCSICGRGQGTILCDMPIGTVKNLHISKIEKLPDGSCVRVTDYNNSFKETTLTCDRIVCEKCAIEISSNIHFCRNCFEKIESLKR